MPTIPEARVSTPAKGFLSERLSGLFMSRPLASVLILIAIVTAATWLRLHRLGGHGLWQDEADSVSFATMPAGKFWKLMWSREGNMLLYYLLLRAWIHVGASEFALRLPSVIIAVLSVVLIYILAKQLFRRSTGLIAATLLSVHMLHVFASQNARSYTLAVLLLLASTSLFIGLARFPGRKLYRVAYPVVSALAMYAQLLAVLVIIAQWLSLDSGRWKNIGWKRSLGVVASFVLLALPMEAFALLKNKGQLSWVPALNFHTFMDGIYALTGSGGMALLALYVVLGIFAAVSVCWTGDSEKRFAIRLVAMWLLFPIVVMVLYSLHKPLFYSRFLILCIPAAALLASEGIDIVGNLQGWRRWVWLPAFVAVVSMSLRADMRYFDSPMWPDWPNATHLALASSQPHDAVCFCGNGAEVFLYYMQREQRVSWDRLPISYYSHGIHCLGKLPQEVSQPNSGYDRVWLLKTDGTEEQYQWILRLLVRRFGSPFPQGTFPSPPGRIIVYLLRGKKP